MAKAILCLSETVSFDETKLSNKVVRFLEAKCGTLQRKNPSNLITVAVPNTNGQSHLSRIFKSHSLFKTLFLFCVDVCFICYGYSFQWEIFSFISSTLIHQLEMSNEKIGFFLHFCMH